MNNENPNLQFLILSSYQAWFRSKY